jgi:hypothetical protein
LPLHIFHSIHIFFFSLQTPSPISQPSLPTLTHATCFPGCPSRVKFGQIGSLFQFDDEGSSVLSHGRGPPAE